MELVDGKPLSQIIRESAPLDYKQVVAYSKQIASGLAAAHKHGTPRLCPRRARTRSARTHALRAGGLHDRDRKSVV